jgi:hypothetical protein
MKKKVIIISVIAIISVVLAYFAYSIYWIAKFNQCQEKMESNIPTSFREEMPILRSPNGYFYLPAVVNKSYKDTFIIDTKASCLSRMERLQARKANYWGTFPVPSMNTYGQMSFLKVFNYRDISIAGCDLTSPLFKGIPQSNGMYDQLYRDVIGKNILERFRWKFNLDKGVLTVFSKKSDILKTEATGYTKVSDGLKDNGVVIKSPYLAEDCRFSMDLGYEGDICVSKEIFRHLAKSHKYTIYLNYRKENLVDTVYEFRHMPISISGIKLSDVTMVYYPSVKKNLVGAKFMGRFNFILSYSGPQSEKSDLYILSRNNSNLMTATYCPKIGCDFRYRNGKCCVTILEINGIAQKCGLKVGDKVISIDGNSVNLNEQNVQSGYVSSYLMNKINVKIKLVRNGKTKELILK